MTGTGRPGRSLRDLAFAILACGMLACGMLAGCGGTETLEAGTILAEGARADLVGGPETVEDDSPQAAAAVQAVVSEIPDRVLGTSSREDFLFQTAEVALQADVNAFGPCLDRRVAQRNNDFDRYVDPELAVFNRNGAKGAWRTSVQVGGCDAPRLHNLLIVTFRDQDTVYLPLLPGTTRADLGTQKLATRAAFAAVEEAAAGGCLGDGKLRVRTTEDKGAVGPDPSRRSGPWREIWITHFCSSDYAVTLVFTPGRDGTAVEAAPGLTRVSDIGWPLP